MGLLGQAHAPAMLASPYGGALAVGEDDEDVWGGLTGTEIGEAQGAAGLGLIGTGRGGGGGGEGTIGLGNTGIIGSGGGGGYGSGYGRGSRGLARDVEMLESMGTDAYAHVEEAGFVAIGDDAKSTFGVDVDTASYTNVRRYLQHRQLPPADAVRIEEMINYFDYDLERPEAGKPFAVQSEVAPCPWAKDHLLVKLALQGESINAEDAPARNMVFLIDVSGSMAGADRLPMLRDALALMVDRMRPQDRVAIVVYAGASGIVLDSSPGTDKGRIRGALQNLESGGSTNGGAGIELAYRVAEHNFIEGGSNRVILATDGDFNVGVKDHRSLVKLIEAKRDSGVFLSVLGVGRGNLGDDTMEALADKGNGQYAYLDSLAEARRVLAEGATGTFAGFGAILVAAFAWAAGNLIAKRAGADHQVDGFSLVVWSSLVPPIPLALVSFAFEGGAGAFAALAHASWLTWACLLVMAWGATLFGFGAWNRLLHHYPMTVVSPFALLVPVSGLASGAILLGERLSIVQAAGVLLVLAGLAVNVLGPAVARRLSR
jgi:uncharacterized membrane protein